MEKREIIDLATGIAGALLLVLTVVLFIVVPEDDPVPPVFQATYTEQVTTLDLTEEHTYVVDDSYDFSLAIDSPYVHHIAFTVAWTDDVASSDPDTFRFQISAPGELGRERITPEPILASNPPGNATEGIPPSYEANPMELVVEQAVQNPPRSGPIPGEFIGETAEEARERLLEAMVVFGAGDWNLETSLFAVGDCPDEQTAPDRALACQSATQGNGDTGNSLTVLSVTYITYDITVEEIVKE